MVANAIIRLVPFGELPALDLGVRIHNIIYGGRGGSPDPWVAADFPNMVRHYETPQMGERRVRELARIAEESRGERGFLAVLGGDDALLGVATFMQQKLELTKGWGFWKHTEVLADGPLLACWLSRPERRRSSPGRHVLPLVLREGAQLLVTNGSLHGRPWTLVRADRNDHGHVGNYLLDTNNGFGGFQVEHRGEFSHVDGVRGERKLYVGHHEIETLRS